MAGVKCDFCRMVGSGVGGYVIFVFSCTRNAIRELIYFIEVLLTRRSIILSWLDRLQVMSSSEGLAT